MKKTHVIAIALGSIALLAASPAVAGGHKNQSSNDELPKACYVIFPTQSEAASYCPVGIQPTRVYDFWQHKFLGWSCDCGPTDEDPANPPDPQTA